jgi:type I restriction enzyme M protein
MATNGNVKQKSLETWIWDAACSIRGAQEAPKFKDFILPLIFTKRLCDVLDDEPPTRPAPSPPRGTPNDRRAKP